MRTMVTKGYEVIAVAPKDEYTKQIKQLSIKHINIPLDRKTFGIIQNAKYFYQLLCILEKYRPEILHNFTIKPVIFGTLIARVLGVKKIIHSVTQVEDFRNSLQMNMIL